jgi:tight adherence protein C
VVDFAIAKASRIAVAPMTANSVSLVLGFAALISALIVLFYLPVRPNLEQLISPYLGLVSKTATKLPLRFFNRNRKKPLPVDSELPIFLDLVAYAMTSGASLTVALRLVTALFAGKLFDQVGLVVSASATGEAISPVLTKLAREQADSAFLRATRAIEISVERGTPLASVLLGQAAQIRAEHTNALTQLAGRKETLMMLPVVFLILPVIVLVALFPGLIELEVL